MSVQARWLAFMVLALNALALFTPVITSGDAVTYAALAQHMVQSHDWASLVLDGQDWLDKPHFPFWLTALFFKLGGTGAFTYMLPGFLFHLVGAYYTYRIACLWYGRDSAWLAVLVYASVFGLMDSAIDVKAEAYLNGAIMAASYYWLCYDARFSVRDLVLGALFTAIALMTKGVFTLVVIGGGFLCMWAVRKQWLRPLHPKWLAALGLSLLFTAPELIALYLQFDSHPEKVVFGRDHVSGIRFFFWDSQFGRFFNTGPITNQHGDPLFFVHVFLWSFLPWTVVFIAAVYAAFRKFRADRASISAETVFLLGAFFIPFLMFSATSFQMDYYLDVVYPFAAILCAKYLSDWLADEQAGAKLGWFQFGVALLLAGLALGLSMYVNNKLLLEVTSILFVAWVMYVLATLKQGRSGYAVVYPVLAIGIFFVFYSLMLVQAFTSYSIGYNVAKFMYKQPMSPVYVYRMPEEAHELALYVAQPTYAVTELPKANSAYFLVVNDNDFEKLPEIQPHPLQLASMRLVMHKTGIFPKLLQLAKGTWPLQPIDVLRVEPPPPETDDCPAPPCQDEGK